MCAPSQLLGVCSKGAETPAVHGPCPAVCSFPFHSPGAARADLISECPWLLSLAVFQLLHFSPGRTWWHWLNGGKWKDEGCSFSVHGEGESLVMNSEAGTKCRAAFCSECSQRYWVTAQNKAARDCVEWQGRKGKERKIYLFTKF